MVKRFWTLEIWMKKRLKKKSDTMKRYMLVSDSCPPCKVLKEREKDRIEKSEASLFSIEKEDELTQVVDILKSLDVKIRGVPAMIEEDDDGEVKTYEGLGEISKRLAELDGEKDG